MAQWNPRTRSAVRKSPCQQGLPQQGHLAPEVVAGRASPVREPGEKQTQGNLPSLQRPCLTCKAREVNKKKAGRLLTTMSPCRPAQTLAWPTARKEEGKAPRGWGDAGEHSQSPSHQGTFHTNTGLLHSKR